MLQGVRLGSVSCNLPVNDQGIYMGGVEGQHVNLLTNKQITRSMYVPCAEEDMENVMNIGHYGSYFFYSSVADARRAMVMTKSDHMILLAIDVTGLHMIMYENTYGIMMMLTDDYISPTRVVKHSKHDSVLGYDHEELELRYKRSDALGYYRLLYVFKMIGRFNVSYMTNVPMSMIARNISSSSEELSFTIEESLYYLYECYIMGLIHIRVQDGLGYFEWTDDTSMIYPFITNL